MPELRQRGVAARPLTRAEGGARRSPIRLPVEAPSPAETEALLERAVSAILRARALTPWRRSALIAVSGIDASGKGHLTSRILARLRRTDLHAVAIGADAWLNPPHVRFGRERPAEHFYDHALRLDEMFESLVLPLRHDRRCRLIALVGRETSSELRPRSYAFDDVDVVLLEGIFLLKSAYRPLYDLSFWVDCTFETALERALARRQEGLSATETIRAYETIYFPAQILHLRRDEPRSAASEILPNDPQLEAPVRR